MQPLCHELRLEPRSGRQHLLESVAEREERRALVGAVVAGHGLGGAAHGPVAPGTVTDAHRGAAERALRVRIRDRWSDHRPFTALARGQNRLDESRQRIRVSLSKDEIRRSRGAHGPSFRGSRRCVADIDDRRMGEAVGVKALRREACAANRGDHDLEPCGVGLCAVAAEHLADHRVRVRDEENC